MKSQREINDIVYRAADKYLQAQNIDDGTAKLMAEREAEEAIMREVRSATLPDALPTIGYIVTFLLGACHRLRTKREIGDDWWKEQGSGGAKPPET